MKPKDVRFCFLLGFLGFLSVPANAASRFESIVGTARSLDQEKILYFEKHRIEYSTSGTLLRAETRYESPEGNLIARLQSDFSESVATPDHVLEDLKSGETQGLRHDGERLVIFDQEKGKSEKKQSFASQDAGDRLFVAGQGLNYELRERLLRKKIPSKLGLRFLIPGRLDYYDFDLQEVPSSEKDQVQFEISIRNWFLSLFASKLDVWYDRQNGRLMRYQGLSNFKNDRGENQVVNIVYKYSDKDFTP